MIKVTRIPSKLRSLERAYDNYNPLAMLARARIIRLSERLIARYTRATHTKR